MTSDELSALRALIREEINAATFASEVRLGERIDGVGERVDQVEHRLGERIDGVDERLARVEERIGNLETTVGSMDERMGNLETTVASMGERLARVEFVQKQMGINLVQVTTILDEATVKINDIQRSQIALETKVEENTASIKRDIQKLNYSVRSFMDNMIDAVSGITMQFSMHKDTPINDAHPPSAA
jgi:chromosome segregation ATPase